MSLPSIYTTSNIVSEIRSDVIVRRYVEDFDQRYQRLHINQQLRRNLQSRLNIRRARTKLKHLFNLDFICWLSDETQLNNHLPVLKVLIAQGYKAAILTNKKRLQLQATPNIPVYFVPLASTEMRNPKFISAIVTLLRDTLNNSKKLRYALIGNDLRWDDRTICYILKKLGIRTAGISHGLNILNRDVDKSICDIHFTWSEKERNNFIRSGKHPNEVLCTGSPAMDDIRNQPFLKNKQSVDSFIEKNSLESFVLVTFSGPGGQISEENHIRNIEFLKNSKDLFSEFGLKLLFKLHRKDHVDYYADIIGDETFVIIPTDEVSLNDSIYPWIERAKALISGPSGSIIDSMLIGKPAYYCDIMEEGVEIDFVMDGIVTVLNSGKSIRKSMLCLRSNPAIIARLVAKQTEYLDLTFGVRNGSSSKRIADYLLNND